MKIGVAGAAGRMGRRIVALAHEDPDAEVTGALEVSGHPDLGKDAGELAGIGTLGVAVSDDTKSVVAACDVLVSFCFPAASVEHVRAAAEAGKGIVVGTTGFSPEQRDEMNTAGGSTRVLIAPNMSMGVNLLFSLVERVARSLGDGYDVEIVETHHRLKKDAPSGTAVRLLEGIAHALGRDPDSDAIHGRKGIVGERTSKEIGVMALRGGDVVGEHTVMFITNGERLELTHRAHSRDAFAKGAVQAALWLRDKPAGVYDMLDVLGLKGDQ
jgi:4-hydroxy-tetrahydrodipicolinate reductase